MSNKLTSIQVKEKNVFNFFSTLVKINNFYYNIGELPINSEDKLEVSTFVHFFNRSKNYIEYADVNMYIDDEEFFENTLNLMEMTKSLINKQLLKNFMMVGLHILPQKKKKKFRIHFTN